MFALILATIVALSVWLVGRSGVQPYNPAVFQLNILGGILAAAAPLIGGLIGNKSASGDRRRSRELSQASIDSAERGARGATQQFGLGSPMRDAFRFGSLNLGGTPAAQSNPFSQDLFGGFSQFLQRESGPGGIGTGFEADAGSRSARSRGGGGRSSGGFAAGRDFRQGGGRSGGGSPVMRGASVKRGPPGGGGMPPMMQQLLAGGRR